MNNQDKPEDSPAPDDERSDLSSPQDDTLPIEDTHDVQTNDGKLYLGAGDGRSNPNESTIDAVDDFAAGIADSSEISFGDVESERTYAAADLNSTVDVSGKLGDSFVAPVVPSERTVGIGINETLGMESTSNLGGNHSVMEDPNISQTINPRELTENDAKFWGDVSAEFSSNGDPSQLEPAIFRSLSETKLQLRDRSVATPKSDPSTKSDYRLVRLLGKGGMGNVFVARQGSLDRLIAVKVIKPLNKAKREKFESQGKLPEVEQSRREQFLSEAVVTGDLDHPNIVPIHDVAVTGDDTLFYAMKRVIGTPWSKEFNNMTQDENVEALLKVADAIGFAHTRGVIHRDIKPENIMLGDFGVVMVMDWGIALATPEFEKRDSIYPATGLGGTPAFMAPEMATGPLSEIGPAADIYLLGATLYMIITGKTPHRAKNVSDCLRAVAKNEIQPVDPQHEGELLQIAMKAMATRQEDRYADVQSFQEAIRDYRSHAESIALTTKAVDELVSGQTNQSYESYSKATFGFDQALMLWPQNETAESKLEESRIGHAELAMLRGDYELGVSVLKENCENHQPLIKQLRSALKERDERQSRMRMLKFAAAAMLAVIIIGGGIGAALIEQQRRVALEAKQAAEEQTVIAQNAKVQEETARLAAESAERSAVEQKEEAQRQEELAKVAKAKAEHQERLAIDAKAEAEESRKQAVHNAEVAVAQRMRAEGSEKAAKLSELAAKQSEAEATAARLVAENEKQRAAYESYVSRIGLAKVRVEANEFKDARRILTELVSESPSTADAWEWRWLNSLVNQAQAVINVDAAVADLQIAPDLTSGLMVLDDGSVASFSIAQDGQLSLANVFRLPLRDRATSVAIAPDGQVVAIGTDRGEIQLWDRGLNQVRGFLRGHRKRVAAIKFVDLRHLVSGGEDRTVRIWDSSTSVQLAACWHIAPVRDLDVMITEGQCLIAAAISDNAIGRVEIWRADLSSSSALIDAGSVEDIVSKVGVFVEHQHPVSTVSISEDGVLVASGDESGEVYVWEVAETRPIDYRGAITLAVAAIDDSRESTQGQRVKRRQSFLRLSNAASNLTMQSDSADEHQADLLAAHSNGIRQVEFSSDSRRVLTCGDDYVASVWQINDLAKASVPAAVAPSLANATRVDMLRGHGGWVTAARFVNAQGTRVATGSTDRSVRVWNLAKQSSVSKPHRDVGFAAAHADEIWSAQFSPDGTKVVTASRDHTARLLSVDVAGGGFFTDDPLTDDVVNKADGSESDRLIEGTSFVAMSIEIDHQHGRIYIGSADSVIRVWDMHRGTEISSASGTGLNASFAVSVSGDVMLTGSSTPDAKAILWRLDEQDDAAPVVLHRLEGHRETVTAFALSPDGAIAFTGDRGGQGMLWDTRTGAVIGTPIDVIQGSRINAATFSPSGDELFIANDDRRVTRIDLSDRSVVQSLQHSGLVTSLSLSNDASQLAVVTELSIARSLKTEAILWDLNNETFKVMASLETDRDSSFESGNHGRVVSAAFGPTPRRLFLGIQRNETESVIASWDTRGLVEHARKTQSFQLPPQLSSISTCRPLGEGRVVSLNGDAGFLWNLESLRHERSYRANGAVTRASFSPDGKFIVTASRSIKVWDAASKRSIAKEEVPHKNTTRTVAFSPLGDKYIFASGGDDGVIRLWRWDAGKLSIQMVARLGNPSTDRAILSLQFSADGKRLLATGKRGTIQLWSLEEQLQASSMIEMSDESFGTVRRGVFSHDGQWIGIASEDTARLWRLDAGDAVPIKLQGHADIIEDLVVLQGEHQPMRVFTASRDKTVRVWDPRIDQQELNGREILSLRGHTQGLTGVDVLPDGNLLMTAARDGRVILWPAN